MSKLFIWIPKTAGSSLFHALQPMRLFLEDNLHKFDNTCDATFGHIDVGYLLERQVLSQQYWESAYKFTVVRNPYDRFISLYEDFLRTSRIRPDCTAIQFAKACLHSVRRPGPQNVFGFSQCASQHHWIKLGVTVLRFEDIPAIEKTLNVKLPLLNVDIHPPWEQYYNPELFKIVTDLYYDDLLVLGYDTRFFG